MPVYPYNEVRPCLGERVFIAPGATVVGDVEAGDDCSFWFHTVARTNIQDGSVLHVTHQTHPLTIGAGVVIGHAAVVHGCTVEDGALIGIGARVLDGAVVERGAQIGAGAVVAPGSRIPAHQLALGVPARVVRPLSDEQRALIPEITARYVRLKDEYLLMQRQEEG